MSAPQGRLVFAIHQIGSGADGGIRSITELVRAVPDIPKLVVTNIESPITEALRAIAPVEIWPMTESAYGTKQSKLAYRIAQVRDRFRNNMRMRRMAKAGTVAVLHANDHRAFWNMAVGARRGGAKVIFNVRGAMRPDSKRKAMWRQALKLCDCFLVLSQEMAAGWKEALRPTSDDPAQAAKFTYLYSIVNDAHFFTVDEPARAAIRARLGITEGRRAIAYVGRFDENKAQADYIEQAGPVLKSLRPDAVTYFVGDFLPDVDPYAARCAASAKALGIEDQLRFVGYSAEVADWYRAADVVVLASRQEGLPRCMIEGLACGAPFVSFDVTSTREILEGHNGGIVVDQGDFPRLATEIAGLLDDAERFRAYRERGPGIVARLFNKDKNGKAYAELVDRLAGRSLS